MNALYTILLVLGLLVAILFALLVFVTGKGDAMSGGGGVRTTFKGKASFDDIMSKLTLYLGISFMALMLGLDVVSNYQKKSNLSANPAKAAPANNNSSEPGPTTSPEPGPTTTPETPGSTGTAGSEAPTGTTGQ